MLTVTRPALPPLDELTPYLEEIWRRGIVTNCGPVHEEFEQRLAEYLGVKYLSLFTNGTLPLMAAFRALDLHGEVITTPYTFVATAHALMWSGLKPVFADVDPQTGCLDPVRVEQAITPETSAILAVHVYGNPCDVNAFEEISSRHGLPVIYDAAHTFGTRLNGVSLCDFGDIATLSFHATKTFNTLEGGALICHDAQTKALVDNFRNFGFRSETEIVVPGINAKMDEVRAACGLVSLRHVDRMTELRNVLADRYRMLLSEMPGITLMPRYENVMYNDGYMPVFVNDCGCGKRRDAIYFALKELGVCGRRYFYPLVSDISPYNGLPSARTEGLQIAHSLADSVICLPLHPGMTTDDVSFVCEALYRCLNSIDS